MRIHILVAVIILACHGRAQSLQRVSVATGGAAANDASRFAVCSADGRYVVFWSDASNLVAGDTNGKGDLFLRDTLAGTTEIVSISSTGSQSHPIVPSNITFTWSSLSADGRYVAFSSNAPDLAPGDTNAIHDVYLRDRSSGTTELVSSGPLGRAAGGILSPGGITADGRYVLFSSTATNLVTGDTNGATDLFLRDRLSGATERVDVSSGGGQADVGALPFESTMTPDGRFIAFRSTSTNLVAGDTNGFDDIFVRDRLNGTTERVNLGPGGVQANSYGEFGVSISDDGRYVAFSSAATNLVPGDTNGASDVFVRDRLSGSTSLANVSSSGAQGMGIGGGATISGDGRFVMFMTADSTLVPGDTNMTVDVFLHDQLAGTTICVSLGPGGVIGNLPSEVGRFSGNDRYVPFESEASNLVSGDTNGVRDVFLLDRGSAYGWTMYCFGDGSGTTCPCGNAGAIGNGCASSVSPVGGHLAAAGGASIANDTLSLNGSGMPNSSALYFQGTTQFGPTGAGLPFGDGLRCVGGSIIRLGTKINVAGASSYPSGSASISVKGNDAAANVRSYQCWYRNAAAFCNPETYNMTNGVTLTWSP